MKLNIYKSKILSLASCLLVLIFVSCGEEDFSVYDTGGVQGVSDPYLQIQTPVVSFQAGTPDYSVAFNVINGSKRLNTVNAYTVFTDATSGGTSAKTLLQAFPVTSNTKEVVEVTLTYADLKAGVTVGGSALPDSDLDLAIGSGWKLSFEGVTDSGETIALGGNVNVAVLSRFAGIYRILDMKYFRIGDDRDDVYASEIGNTRFIGSVDETTFSYNDYWGPFGWTGSSFHFSVDFSDNSITVPIIVAGLFSGNRATNCTDDAAELSNVPCDGSNILIPDDVDGKHRIILTYGYFTDGSGAREFWEVLEKVVD